MTVIRTVCGHLSFSILLTCTTLGCGGGTGKPASTPSASVAASRAAPLAPTGPLKVIQDSAPEVRPELPSGGVLQPMSGDPDAQVLQQVRLQSSSCEEYESTRKELIEAEIREMHEALKQSFQNWKSAQPDCWEMYREEAEAMRRGPIRRYAVKSATSGYGGSVPAMAAPAKAEMSKRDDSTSKSRVSAGVRSASGTNNQVQGVDEADIVKHDGKYVYFAVNGALRIASINPPKLLSATSIQGQVKELLVEGDRAVVYAAQGGNGGNRCTYGYDCQFGGDGSRTIVTVFDLSARQTPKAIRTLEFSGSLIAARRIGNTIHTVVADGDRQGPRYSTWPGDLEECGVREATVKKRLKQLGEANERLLRDSNPRDGLPTIVDRGNRQTLCQNLTRTPISDGNAFTTIASFDLTQNESVPVTTTIQSRPGAVFVSEEALYLSVTHQKPAQAKGWYGFYGQIDEVSDIHKFRVGSRPEATAYVGSGVVPGHVLNQFSMDEWYGYLRIATTRGRVPSPNVESQVSIFATAPNGNLIRTGAVEHIAPGEDIRSVRFDNERGYVVTFKKTDPLFVLDLRRPHHPAVLGELKIPGFSTYMHRIDPNHLLSIGLDANDHGYFAYFDGVILQLFDVTNPTDPKLLHKEKIGTRGSSSEAITNHLAFNYFGERGLLAIPMTVCEGGGDGTNGDKLSFSGLLVYGVSVRDGFKRLGGVNHGTVGANCGTWWSQANSTVKRSLFLDDWVWSIALDRTKVQSLSNLGHDLADLTLN